MGSPVMERRQVEPLEVRDSPLTLRIYQCTDGLELASPAQRQKNMGLLSLAQKKKAEGKIFHIGIAVIKEG